MNERIKELEIQCWEPRQYGPAWFNSAKFAELIIKKCMQCCGKVEDDDNYDDYTPDCAIGVRDGALLCKIEIKQHFGVEL